MRPESDWTQRAFELFDEAVELPPEEWEARVARLSNGDTRLAAEVMGLLDAHLRDGGLLDRPLPSTWPSLGDDSHDRGGDVRSDVDQVHARIAEALASRYDRFERLGMGGMAIVFRAREQKHDRPVVLKVLRPEVARSYGEDRFLAEVKVVSALSHPHILALIDSGRADGLLYYVMPDVGGETLGDRLRKEGPLTPETAQPILRDVADALAYAHGQGVVHRDLKPDNVLCSGSHAWLMDFGIAKALIPAREDRDLTQAGASPGTPRYMAPEQLEEGGTTAPHSDVFAFGQMAHEVLTGAVVPGGNKRATEIARRIEVQVGGLPPAWGLLIGRTLAPEPWDRPTARELVEGWNPVATTPAWRNPVAAALMAAAVAVLLFLGASRILGPATPPVSPNDRVAVAAFQNETGDAELDFLGRMVGDWLTQGLRDLEEFRVVPWELSQEVAELAAGDSAMDPVVLLHTDAGAGTVVTGRFYRFGEEISIGADITEAATMRVVAGVGPVTASWDRPEAAVQELRDRVLGALSASVGPRTAQNVSVVSSAPRIDAYRAYDSGRRHHLAQEYELARDQYLLAHERDTTFLPALLAALGSAYNLRDLATQDSILSHLGARRDRLSRFEDLRWQYFDALGRSDRPATLAALRESLKLAHSWGTAYNLAVMANSLNRPAEALASLQTLNPDEGVARGWAQYWTQLSHSLHLLGRHAEEFEAAAAMRARYPERTVAHSLVARALAAAGQLNALDEALEASSAITPRTYWSHGAALVIAAQALMAHGQAEDAESYLEAAE
ncbi:MAG: protein kinase, partial [Gemmatimonadetes bacterium]|nr:protein kinase [Gemmatimonadota bacterium]